MNCFVKVLALVAIVCLATPALRGRDVVVMTYNVHNGVGLDKKRNHGRIAEIIGRYKPDFVAVQELDSATNRSGKAYVLGEIADSADMHHVFAPAISYDGGLYGIGLLSQVVPDSVSRIALPGREESRMLITAHFDDYIVIATHLSLTPEDALASTQIIKDVIRRAGDKTIILMGDLNSLPSSPVITQLQQDFAIISPDDVATFPANLPTERIDYVMISKNSSFAINRAEVIDERSASDHRPIVVWLTIND